jgi:hypothetical protein
MLCSLSSQKLEKRDVNDLFPYDHRGVSRDLLRVKLLFWINENRQNNFSTRAIQRSTVQFQMF